MSDYESRPSRGTDATDVARQEGQHVQDTARYAASNVKDTAASRGQEIKGQARRHARGIADDAQRQLRGHAQEETQRAGAALGTAGDQLRALADGRVDEAGVFGTYVEAAADAVTRWADTIQDRGLDGLLDDLRSFGRRRPGMFLAGALAAGIVAGRFGRNAAQEVAEGDGSSPDDTARTPQPAGSTGTGGDRVAREDAAWRPTGGLVDAGDRGQPVSGGGTTASDRPADDDLIVGHASDDSVVVSPGGGTSDQGSGDRPVAPPRDADDVEHRPVDVDQERSR